MLTEIAAPEPEPAPDTAPRQILRPPAWLETLAVVPASLLLLWAVSVPAVDLVLTVVAGVVLVLGTVLWVTRLATAVKARKATEAPRLPGSLLVVPLIGLAVLALVVTQIPIRARWAASRSSFIDVRDTLVLSPGSTTDPVGLVHPDRIGWYDITDVFVLGDAVIFVEGTRGLTDEGGFAYLPHGPFPELVSRSGSEPKFRDLGDGWYAFIAGF